MDSVSASIVVRQAAMAGYWVRAEAVGPDEYRVCIRQHPRGRVFVSADSSEVLRWMDQHKP